MKKITSKILAVLLIFTLAGFQFITTGVYASDLLKQNSDTNVENVKFNATLGNDNSKSNYNYTANINSNENKMYLKLDVLSTGYLKDIVIHLENNNYIWTNMQYNDSRVKNISSDRLELNQINAGETVELAIPIMINKEDEIAKDTFNKESKIILEANYVNDKNKEIKIHKELKENLSWTLDEGDLVEETSQEVIRYLTYNNQTMLSVVLNDKFKDSKLPITSKELQVTVPTMSGKKPSKILISAIQTANTNGKEDGTSFSNENWHYDENSGIITINLKNEENQEGKIVWNKELADKFVITYLYDINMNEIATTITSKVISNITLANGVNFKSETLENDYKIDGKIGDIVNAEIVNNQDTLNKGYMYNNINTANEKKETEFSQKYKINIGLVETMDKVIVQEKGEFFDNENVSEFVYNKKISVSKDEFIKLLGENGNINVYKEDNSLIGTLTKDVLSIDVNASNIKFELSKPLTEGEISINVDKAIKGELNFSKKQLQQFSTLTSKIAINKEIAKSISLEEPSSKASIEINNTNLSTVVKNEDIIITATLETNDITDALYENPELTIKLPEEVKNIDLKDAKLLYEDELVQNEFTVKDNTIYLSLKGLQTKYATQSTSKGTVVRLVVDLTLDNLAPSKTTNMSLNYTNSNEVVKADLNTVQVPVEIVAPTGFVTTNTLSGYNGEETVTSQEGKESIGKLVVFDKEKEMTVSGTIVNNLGKDATGVKLLGRIPFKGNKEIGSSEDLGSTIDTQLLNEISIDGIDAKIYYSENGDATNDLNEPNNGWKTEFTQNAKSYMIVANNAVTNTSKFNFNYKVKIPANLPYGSVAKENYAIYYDNDSEEGSTQNVVSATKAGVSTGEIPSIQTNINLKDMFTGAKIENGGSVEEGQYLEYNFVIKNNGNEVANNVNAKISLPEGYSRVNIIPSDDPMFAKSYVVDTETKEFEEKIESIAPGEERVITMYILVTSRIFIDGENFENSIRISVKADKMENTSDAIFTTKLSKGYLSMILGANYEDKILPLNQQVEYFLTVENVNNEEKNNVNVKVKIPECIKFTSIVNCPENVVGEYDEKNNEVTFNIGNMKANNSIYLSFNGIVEKVGEGSLETKAIATCNETDKQIVSNTVKFLNEKHNVKASMTSNIVETNLYDTDKLEYYIDIKNEGNIPEKISFLDNIPQELTCESYKIEITNGVGNEDVEYSSNQLSKVITLNAKGSARITIRTKPKVFESGNTKEITNLPEINLLEENGSNIIQNVEVNSLTHTIEGTGGSDSSDGNRKYRIAGTIWIDSNSDGKKDIDEQRVEGLKVSLFDQTTGNIVKDQNGKDITTTTSKEGRYNFEGLPIGNYLVVVEYDTANYELTTYRASNVSETENSDFIDAKLDTKKVAATNTITIDGESIYNIDLGLKQTKQFDLSLNKTVSKITVTNTKLDTQVYEYNKSTAMVSLPNTYVEYATVLIEYNLTVTNEGAIPGYAKEIVDALPDGMDFSSNLNNTWYLGSDGKLYNTSLANSLLNPGESKTIKLILSRKMTGENTGTVSNIAEISKDYNEQGKQDVDSTPGNNKDGEDDKSVANTIITMGTGKEVAAFIGITLGVLAIIGTAVILIKKYIIKKI